MLGPDKRVVPILLQGLDQKQPRQAGGSGVLQSLTNMVVSKAAQGGYEFVPRPGSASVSKTADTGSITTGQRLGVLGQQLLLLTGTSAYRKATDKWHLVDATAPTFGVQTSPMVSNSTAAYSAGSVYANGYRVSAAIVLAVSGRQLLVSISDASGVVVTSAVVATGAALSAVRVVACGNNVVVVWQQATLSLMAVKVDTTVPGTISGSTTISSTAAVGVSAADVQAVGSSPTQVAIAYLSSSTSTWHLRLLTPSSMTLGTDVDTTIAGVPAFSFLANDWSTSELFVGWGGGGAGLSVTKFNASTLATVGTSSYDPAITFVNSITGTRAGSSVVLLATTTPDGTIATASAPAYDIRVVKSTGGAVTDLMRSVSLASKAIAANGTVYVMVLYGGPLQGTLFLVDAGAKKLVGKALPDVAGVAGMIPNNELPELATTGNASTWLTAAINVIADTSTVGSTGAYTGAVSLTWTLEDSTVDRPVELNGLHIPGALPCFYDGQVVVEDGFPIAPEQADTPVTAAPGSKTAGAFYIYRYCYAWPDALGNLHRSAPSIIGQKVTLGGSDHEVTLAIPTLRATRRTNVTVEIYETPVNGDGTVYYLIGSVLNNPAVDRVTFTDSGVDADIVGGEPLYTNGGILDNIAPPPCKTMAKHRGRLLIGGVDNDPQAVWFSKNVGPGFGVSFSDGLVSRLNQTTEMVTALGSMDAYAVAFTAGTTWASGNDYPDDTGQQGVLSFQQYSESTGVARAGLAGRTDQGMLVYASNPKGAWRLSRGVTYDYVGSAIEDDMATVSPVAVIAVGGFNQVRFVAGTTVLVYETLYGTWATWTYAHTPAPFVDATVWQGQVAYLCSDGTVVLESQAVLDDNGLPDSVQHVVAFAGFNFAGIAGFARLFGTQLTGRLFGVAGFTMTFTQAFDGVSIPNKAMVYTGAEAALNVEVDPGPSGKCSTYTLTISDSANGANSGFSLVAITALIGIEAGLAKLPPARRAT